MSQRSLVQLNRLTAFQRSYFFNPCGIYISLLLDLSTCFLQNQNRSSSSGFNHADTSTSHVSHITLHLPNPRMKWDLLFLYECLTAFTNIVFLPLYSSLTGLQLILHFCIWTLIVFPPSWEYCFVLSAVGCHLVGLSMETTSDSLPSWAPKHLQLPPV